MSARLWVAGGLAGVVVFAWGMVAHMALPLGEMGVETLAPDSEVVAAIARETGDGGFFLYPYTPDTARFAELYRTSPRGILAVAPAGGDFNFPLLLGGELLSNIVGGLFAAFLFAAALPTLGNWKSGAMAGAVLGAFAEVAIDVSYWNWYSFPTEFVVGQLIMQVVGWALAGAFLGWRLGKS